MGATTNSDDSLESKTLEGIVQTVRMEAGKIYVEIHDKIAIHHGYFTGSSIPATSKRATFTLENSEMTQFSQGTDTYVATEPPADANLTIEKPPKEKANQPKDNNAPKDHPVKTHQHESEKIVPEKKLQKPRQVVPKPKTLHQYILARTWDTSGTNTVAQAISQDERFETYFMTLGNSIVVNPNATVRDAKALVEEYLSDSLHKAELYRNPRAKKKTPRTRTVKKNAPQSLSKNVADLEAYVTQRVPAPYDEEVYNIVKEDSDVLDLVAPKDLRLVVYSHEAKEKVAELIEDIVDEHRSTMTKPYETRGIELELKVYEKPKTMMDGPDDAEIERDLKTNSDEYDYDDEKEDAAAGSVSFSQLLEKQYNISIGVALQLSKRLKQLDELKKVDLDATTQEDTEVFTVIDTYLHSLNVHKNGKLMVHRLEHKLQSDSGESRSLSSSPYR